MKKLFPLLLAGIAGGLTVLTGLLFFGEPKQPGSTSDNFARAIPVNRYQNQSPRLTVLPTDFTKAAELAMPVVTHISASEERNAAPAGKNPGWREDPFRFFFGDDFFFNFPFDAPPKEGTGSGVIVSPDGYIVTNNHVIEFADKIEVTLYDERTLPAIIVGVDERTDLAVLKIDAQNLPVMDFADSETAKVGEWVLAVGNPFDLTSTVTAGIISAKGRDIDIIRRSDAIENFIQTDAAVNPGNSGGALVTTDGRLLGINTAIASPTGAFAGYSFAIPSNLVQEIVNNIITFGGARGELGLQVMDLDEELAAEEGLSLSEGVYVYEVENGSAAQYAGLLPSDVITEINGQPVQNAPQLIDFIDNIKIGEEISLTVNRRGKVQDVRLLLRPASAKK